MANPSIAEGTACAHPLKVVKQIWTDDYTGTAEQLIAAGIVKPGQFPGDPGMGKVRVTHYADGVSSGSTKREKVLVVQRVGKKFCAGVYVSKAERERRLVEQHGERRGAQATAENKRAAAEAEAEVERAKAKLAGLAASKKEYAKRAANVFWAGYHIFDNAYAGGLHESGYRFTAADQERILAMARRLYCEICRSKPRFDAAHRMRDVTAARAKAAKCNLPLQHLLAEAIALPPQPDEGWTTEPASGRPR